MVQPADFADHLKGEAGRTSPDVWLILCDLLADLDRQEDADALRQCILSGLTPDQFDTFDEWIIVVPGFRIRTIHVQRQKSRPRPQEID
jgi:hypothetical protein